MNKISLLKYLARLVGADVVIESPQSFEKRNAKQRAREEKIAASRDELRSTTKALRNRIAELEGAIAANDRHYREQLEAYNERCFIQMSAQSALLRYSNAEYAAHLAAKCASGQPRILLAGFYGADNYGDELMLRSLLSCVPRRYLSYFTVLLCDVPTYDMRDLPPEVHWIHYPKSAWDVDLLSELFDCLVWGGGAIIDERQYVRDCSDVNTGNIFIRLSEKMISRAKPVYCLGLSANYAFESQEFIRALNVIAERSEAFTLRDPYSIESLVNAGIAASDMELCDDLVFAHEDFLAVASYDRLGPIGIAPICYSELDEFNELLIEVVVAALDRVADDRQVLLVPFFENQETDSRYLRQLADRVAFERIDVAQYSRTVNGSAIPNCSAFVTLRYHGALVSNALGIPTLSICWDSHRHYPNKMKHISDMFPETISANLNELDRSQLSELVDMLLGKTPASNAPYVAARCRSCREDLTEKMNRVLLKAGVDEP